MRQLILLSLLLANQALADPTVGDTIAETALLTDVSVQVLLAVCRAESSLTPGEPYMDGSSLTYPPCGIKFTTAQHMGYKGFEVGLTMVHINAFYAAKYLKYLHNRYQSWTKAVVAYNRGMKATDRLSVEQCEETQYFKRVMREYHHGYN